MSLHQIVPLALLLAAALSAGEVTFVVDPSLDAPARHGLAKLEAALEAQGETVSRAARVANAAGETLVLAGRCSGNGPAVSALRAANAALPKAPEGLAVQRIEIGGKPAVALCGTDSRGLMYAALDLADRISWRSGSDPLLEHVRETSEAPYVRERAISIYTMQRAYFEERLYDEAYWARYLDLLAASRINSFVVIFGYENGGFMAPLYPYFFDVPAFPDVSLVGITAEQQQRNVAAFRQMIHLAHERGIDFVPAVWDHIYRGGVQGGGIAGASDTVGKRVAGLVSGVTAQNLAPYTKAALRKFLEVFPNIDGLQFRMHGESGLKREEMAGFWHEVFMMIKQRRPDLRVDLRAKQLPDAIIQDAVSLGLRARVATKYWMEQMGMPFHPTHVNRQNQRDRRHGYADLLRHPQQYKVHWRMWNGGTTRMLLWADPDYVRRFVDSTRVYDGDSFEVNEMLATKMLGEPHDKKPFPLLAPRFRYYDYEFERYWHYYQLWGRVSYNPETPAETWEREFQRRLGKQAGAHLWKGLHLASKVLPRIVAASYRYRSFPTTRGWAEMMRLEDLPTYAGDEEGTDTQQFLNVREEARLLLENGDTAKRRPPETSRWFSATADRILGHVAAARGTAGPRPGNEFVSTVTDLRILAGLARYHSHRLPAGVSYNLYKETGDLSAFDDAISHERRAMAAWETIVDAAADVYNHDLAFGVHRVGFPRHWREELGRLREGLEKLESERRQAQPGSSRVPKPKPTTDREPPQARLQHIARAKPGERLMVTASVSDPSGVKRVRLRYRHLTQFEDYETQTMQLNPTTGLYEATIPGTFLIPKWDLIYFLETVDIHGNGRMYPDLETETPYVIVRLDR